MMNILEVLMLVFMIGTFCIMSFLLGAFITVNKKKITLNPVQAYKEHKEEQQQREENDLKQRQLNTLLENIDNYNGSALGQKDIPNK